MGQPEAVRRIRLWAAATSYNEIKRLNYPELFYHRLNLYELGSVSNDLIEYKRVVALASAPFSNPEQTNKFLNQYKNLLLPELSKDKFDPDNMSSLMKELENTIVVIDKESIKSAGK